LFRAVTIEESADVLVDISVETALDSEESPLFRAVTIEESADVLVEVSDEISVESDWSAAALMEASDDTPPPTALESDWSTLSLVDSSVERALDND
jgi:hypothetical protein